MSRGTPGAQAWYDQAIIVDPHNANHVFLDLEEVFETNNAGQTWTTTGPYWNFPLPCWNVDPKLDTCPGTVHADQHALAISGGTLYTADDGGVYAHQLAKVGVVQWRDLNATLHTLQYYYSAIGRAPNGKGDYIWGGMQDNGVGLLKPGAKQMVSPFGGDGTDNIVDPNNGNRAVNSYVDLTMASTTNGGRSDGHTEVYNTISPSCLNPIYQSNPCDPNPRFVAPFSADIHNINHWVAGGEFVWDNQGKGWNTNCSATACDWKQVYDTGVGNSINTIADSGPVTYAGWCGNGCNPGGSAPFTSGLATNFGGTWHAVTGKVLPNRVPTSFTIDPANSAHVVVTFGGFSRHWIPNAGVGHVFVTLNGGKTWTNVSGNLPDAPATGSDHLARQAGRQHRRGHLRHVVRRARATGSGWAAGSRPLPRSTSTFPRTRATCWWPRTARACGGSADHRIDRADGRGESPRPSAFVPPVSAGGIGLRSVARVVLAHLDGEVAHRPGTGTMRFKIRRLLYRQAIDPQPSRPDDTKAVASLARRDTAPG